MKKIICLFVFIHILLFTIHSFAQIPTTKGNWQWARSMGSTVTPVAGGVEKINCMKTDSKGNTYTSGYMYYNPKVQGYHGGKAITQLVMNHSNINNTVGFIAKHNCNGNLEWINLIYDTINGGVIKDFAVDTSGNVYFVADLNGWGQSNIYWNDSLIRLPASPATTSGASVLFKINNSGKLLWRYSILDVYGVNSQLQFAIITMVNYKEYDPSFLFIKNDTLYALGTVDTFNYNYGFISVLKFNINSGALIERNRVIKHTINSGAKKFKGFGINQQGNFLAALNIQQDTIKILDTTLIQNGGIGKAILFEFNKTHFIKHLQLGDSAGFYYVDLNNTELDEIEFIVSTEKNKHVFANYYSKTRSSWASSNTCAPLMRISTDLKTLRWGLEPDSAVYSGSFSTISKTIFNKDAFSNFNIKDCAIFGKDTFRTNNPNEKWQKIARISADSGKIISLSNDILTKYHNINGHDLTITYLSIHENGNISVCGEFTNNSIITPNDTAPSFGGNNDLFIMQYGYPWGSDSALIEPVATTQLTTQCLNNDSVILVWKDNSNIEWGYHIYRAVANRNATYNLIATTLRNVTTFTDNTIATNSNYWYKVAAFNNVGDGIATNLDSSIGCKPLGINEINPKNELQIYPNPTGNQLTISNKMYAITTIEITDVLGKICTIPNFQSGEGKFELNISTLASGTYFIKAKDSKGNVSLGKFVKE